MKDRGFIHRWLLPLSWPYGLAVRLRNRLFDLGVLREQTFPLPVICVGNLTVGGTGKTPHVEYLIRLLRDHCRVAVLSRGYKRKTQGYVLATADSTQQDIGDEPYQMKRKFSGIHVAVDADRREGITRLTTDGATGDTQVILLDDAFQHRYVKPGLSILLTDCHRLITRDALLPAGRLREPTEGKRRADVIIVTKCPKELTEADSRAIAEELKPDAGQQVFFTTLEYGRLRRVFGSGGASASTAGDDDPDDELPLSSVSGYHVLLLTGIASPSQMVRDLSPYNLTIRPLTFPDHHDFTEQDERTIQKAFDSLPEPRIIITTEKDATRMKGFHKLSRQATEAIHELPITVVFLHNQQQTFNEKILHYVRENQTDRPMA